MTRVTKIRLLLLLVILLVYGQIVTHDFVDWDDGPLIYNNNNIKEPTWTSLSHHWNPWSGQNYSMYNPLVFSVWWVLAHWAKVSSPDVLGATLNPYLFHAANLVVHWLGACVVFEILRRLRISDWASGAGAMIFAIHPMQTEPVAWATGMKDVLSGLFALLCIWRYIEMLEAQGKRRKREYIYASAFFLLALLSKPSTVVVPLMVGAIDRILYRGTWRAIGKRLWPWLIASAGFAAIASSIQKMVPSIGGPLWARPLIALYSLAFYMGKVILPIDLRIDYGRNPKMLLTDPALHHPLFWAWIFPVLLGLAIWRSRNEILTTAAVIFVAGVLPVLGLTAFAYEYYTTVADRYVYLSLVGVSLSVGWTLNRYRNRWVWTGVAAIIVVLGSLSFVDAARWTDTDALYSYSIDGTRSVHFLILGDYQGDLAKPYFRRAFAAEQGRNYLQARQENLQGSVFVQRAISDYQEAIKMEPLEPDGYDRLAKILLLYNHIPDAIKVVRRWQLIDPKVDPDSQEPPGQLDGMLGELYLKTGQLDNAIESLKKSVAEKPGTDYQKVLEKAEAIQMQLRSTSRPTTR